MVDSQSQFLRLLTLLSPVFPVGGFAYSHGIEQAVHDKFIKNRQDLAEWLNGLIFNGSAHNDIILLCEAWRLRIKTEALNEIVILARALSPSYERELETTKQGTAFIAAARAFGWNTPLNLTKKNQNHIAYPIAIGIVAADMDIALPLTVMAYLHGFLANLVQAAIRLVPLGQKDGVKLMAELEQSISQQANHCENFTLCQLGSAAFMSDIMAMRHETLYSRIFRS